MTGVRKKLCCGVVCGMLVCCLPVFGQTDDSTLMQRRFARDDSRHEGADTEGAVRSTEEIIKDAEVCTWQLEHSMSTTHMYRLYENNDPVFRQDFLDSCKTHRGLLDVLVMGILSESRFAIFSTLCFYSPYMRAYVNQPTENVIPLNNFDMNQVLDQLFHSICLTLPLHNLSWSDTEISNQQDLFRQDISRITSHIQKLICHVDTSKHDDFHRALVMLIGQGSVDMLRYLATYHLETFFNAYIIRCYGQQTPPDRFQISLNESVNVFKAMQRDRPLGDLENHMAALFGSRFTYVHSETELRKTKLYQIKHRRSRYTLRSKKAIEWWDKIVHVVEHYIHNPKFDAVTDRKHIYVRERVSSAGLSTVDDVREAFHSDYRDDLLKDISEVEWSDDFFLYFQFRCPSSFGGYSEEHLNAVNKMVADAGLH
eukprot:GHVQ01007375.1.p1 GENE.GHVQ01007375.1~~GHVQ01007375.1.p1  ORF type:complete len:426 (-),score=43.27 GHVQ01007375.1:183-1460(-)